MTNKLSINLQKLMSMKGSATTILANELGIPASNIYRILRGETQKPKKNNIRKLAEYFNITYDELIGEIDIDWGRVDGWLDMVFSACDRIPLCSWQLGECDELKEITNTRKVITTTKVSHDAFALQIHEQSLDLLPFNSIIICDPEQKPVHGSFVLLKLKNNNTLYLRKLLKDIDGNFLKSLDKNFDSNHICKMNSDINIFATVVHVQYDIA